MSKAPEVCFLERFLAPRGYSVEAIVGSTYSLNPTVLLAILVATSLNSGEASEFVLEDCTKEQKLNAIRENIGKCLVFCDHNGSFKGKFPFSEYEQFVLSSVVKQIGRSNSDGGSLHSKFLLVTYKNNNNEYIGRLYIGSKNLTEEIYREYGIIRELKWQNSGRKCNFVKTFSEYLQYLSNFESKYLKKNGAHDALVKVINVLKKDKLYLPLPESKFYWQGRDPAVKNGDVSLFKNWNSWITSDTKAIFIHSPWSRATVINPLLGLLNNKANVYIKCLNESGLNTVKSKNVFYELSVSGNDRLQPHHSHAKIYLIDNGRKTKLVFGSANCTADAWGLSNKINSEILVSMDMPTAELSYLTKFSATAEVEIIANKTSNTEDIISEFLDSINVNLSFDTKTNSLAYNFYTKRQWPKGLKTIVVTQALNEEFDGQREFEVFSGKKITKEVFVPWEKTKLYIISALIRISDPQSGLCSDYMLSLDLSFFRGRENLKCLSFTAQEFINSLAELMDVELSTSNQSTANGHDLNAEAISEFIKGIRLERYAYKMSKLKNDSPLLFESKIRRIETLLRLGPDIENARLEEALIQVRKMHGVLSET